MPDMYCELHVHPLFVETRTPVSFITHVNLCQFIPPSDYSTTSICAAAHEVWTQHKCELKFLSEEAICPF